MNDNVLVADIEGYAALFGRPDLNGDVIEPGAFRKTLARRAAPVRMLYQHAAAAPIGRWTSFAEDARGLYATGELLLSAPTPREVHALIAGGAMDGLSIGYQTVRARKAARGSASSRRGRRIIEADLWEVSIVTFPMAAGARVTFVGDPRPETQSQDSTRVVLSARSIRRAPASPTGARQFSGVQFATALRGAASILSV